MIEKQIILKDHLVNYYAVESAKPAAKTAIFLHGWRANGMIWTPVVKLLSGQDYNVYCLDLPGFGKSEFPQKPFHLREYAEIVKEFIERVILSTPSQSPPYQGGEITIIGHSFGGRVAAKLSAQNPDLVKKLVLVDSGGFRKSEWKRGFITFLAKITGPAFALPLLQTLRPRIYNILGADDYLAMPELKNSFINIINEDLLEIVRKIVTPTLIIWGKNDQEVPLQFGQKMHGLIPGSNLVILEQSGHFSFLDKPEDFVKTLKKFIQ